MRHYLATIITLWLSFGYGHPTYPVRWPGVHTLGRLKADPQALIHGVEPSGFLELPLQMTHAAPLAHLPFHIKGTQSVDGGLSLTVIMAKTGEQRQIQIKQLKDLMDSFKTARQDSTDER